jgi:peptidoglycan/xylan/chitin deacetylase (PgdA/CDA1 family)
MTTDDTWAAHFTGPAHASRRRSLVLGLLATLAGRALAQSPQQPAAALSVPVLVYHRFAATAVDSMTVRLATFQAHLDTIERLGGTVLPLDALVDRLLGRRASLPPRAVVLTADDGHRSQFEAMAPLLRHRRWPATLFVYPSAISNASYAMQWDQLRELVADGLFTVQSHTFWHPNLVRDRQHMAPAAFEAMASDQLSRSKSRLERELGRPVSQLAWPFGLTDAGLMALAGRLGYEAAFVLGNRAVTAGDPVLALPRLLVTDALSAPALSRWLGAVWR